MNAFCHYNLATALLHHGDSMKAYEHYVTANDINSRLTNPLDTTSLKLSINKAKDSTSHKMERATFTKPDTHVQKETHKTYNEDEEINPIHSDFVRMRMGDKYGVLHYTGDTVLTCKYDYVGEHVYIYKNKMFFIVGNNKLFGALDKVGKTEIPITYSSVESVKLMIQKKVNNQL